MYCDRKIALLVVACSVSGQDVDAAEWALEGALGQELQYNDNISLNPIRKDPVVGYLLTPGFQATRKSGVLDLAFGGRADIRRYDDQRWDCDNFNLDANNSYRKNRSVFSLTGGYGVSCSYNLQLTDTGVILPNNQTENYRLAPSWTWQWTARDQLILDASYSKTSYSSTQSGIALNNNSSIFSGNDNYTVHLGGKHEWSQRLSLNEKLYFSNIQYTGSNTSTQNLYGFQLGADYKIDRLWTVGAGGGPVWVDTQPGSNDTSSIQNSSMTLGRVANINLNYNGQVTDFSIGYSNTVNPSAIGQTLQTQSAFANYSYHLTRDLMLDLSSSYSLSQSIGKSTDNSNTQFNRTYFTGAAGLTWELEKHWQLKGSYVYRWQNYKQDQNLQNFNVGTSDSNLVMLFLNYSWDGIRVSR